MDSCENMASYTVQLRARSGDTQLVGQFDDRSLGLFFDELGVSSARWDQWHAAAFSTEPFELVPGFPQISRLSGADEGIISYKSSSLERLTEECIRVRSIYKIDPVGSVFRTLCEGSRQAVDQGAELIVHPFGIDD